MTSDAVVRITDRARAVLAFAKELELVDRQIADERARHARTMDVLLTKKQALEKSIFQYGAN